MGIEKYMNIIDHEHHVSERHPQMSLRDRAAQFAPFAALTGYDDVIHETGRQTDSRIELDEMRARKLDEALNELVCRVAERPAVLLTIFVKDARKKGGRYTTLRASIRDISLPERKVVLVGGKAVSLDDIADITIL